MNLSIEVTPGCRPSQRGLAFAAGGGRGQPWTPGDGRETTIPITRTHDPLLHRVLKNTYRVTEVLNEGGMGTVYAGEHLRLKVPLAIKVLHDESLHREDYVERFRREALLQAMVKHPGAVSIIDLDETTDGILFIVMEFCPGRSLAEVLDEECPMPLDRVMHITRQLLEILAVAHESRIIHRDLKPENIMLEKQEDGSERVRILDFGVATILEEVHGFRPDRPDSSSVWGTPWYISPEQALGREVGGQADLYSLGVVMYEMLTGKLPLEDENLDSFYAQLVNVRPRPLRDLRPDLPARVDRAVMMALNKLPVDRPESPAAMRQILTKPPTSRSRRPLVLLAGVCATLIFALGFVLGHRHSAGGEERLQVTEAELELLEREARQALQDSGLPPASFQRRQALRTQRLAFERRAAGRYHEARTLLKTVVRLVELDLSPRERARALLETTPAGAPHRTHAHHLVEAGDALLSVEAPGSWEVDTALSLYQEAQCLLEER